MTWTPTRMAEMMNRLERVEWDRAITAPVASDDGVRHEMTIVYGWIERPRSAEEVARDYVQLEFASWADEPGFSTSSARYSEEMNRIIYGPGAPHYPCVKISEGPLGPHVQRIVRWSASD